MVAMLVLVGVTGVVAIQVATVRIESAANRATPGLFYNADVLQSMTNAQAALRGYTLVANRRALLPYENAVDRVERRLPQLSESVGDDAAGRRLVANHERAIDAWLRQYAAAKLELPAGRFDRKLHIEGRQLFREIRNSNQEVQRLLEDRIEAARAEAESVGRLLMLASGLLTVLAAGVGFAASVFVSRGIRGPLSGVRDTLDRLTGGDHDRRASIEGPLEVAQIATAVNLLADEGSRLRAVEAQELQAHQRLIAYQREVREALDPDEVAIRATQELGTVLDADHVYVRLVEDGEITPAQALWSAPGVEPLSDRARRLVVGSVTGMQQLRDSRESLVVNDTSTHPFYDTDASQRWLEATGAKATLMMMITVDGIALGVVTVICRNPRQWTARAIRVGEAVATDLGLALEHARLFAAQVQAVETLQALDRSKDSFMSTVSHELRTPLTSISGYLELLEGDDDASLSDDQRRLLSVIRRNSDRLRLLIEDLLTLSRIEAGGFRTLLTDVDLAATVRGVVEDLSPAAAAAEIDLSADLATEPLTVAGDATQMSRALLNLTGNAIKFTPGGGDVHLSLGPDPGPVGTPKPRALLTIRDTGIGIPAEDQSMIFTRFFRASNATTANIPGTGLGLVIVRMIVENHGGRVHLESEVDRGTTVSVSLALRAETVAEALAEDGVDPPEPPAVSSGVAFTP